MSLAEIATNGPSNIEKGPTCTVCLLMGSLPDTEAAALGQMLADPTWRYSSIAAALGDEGHPVLDQTVSRHARGVCGARKRLR